IAPGRKRKAPGWRTDWLGYAGRCKANSTNLLRHARDWRRLMSGWLLQKPWRRDCWPGEAERRADAATGWAARGKAAAGSAAEGTRAGVGVGAHARDRDRRPSADGAATATGVARTTQSFRSGAREKRVGSGALARVLHERSKRAARGLDCHGNGVHERRRASRCGSELSRDEAAGREYGSGQHDGARGIQRVRAAVHVPDARTR